MNNGNRIIAGIDRLERRLRLAHEEIERLEGQLAEARARLGVDAEGFTKTSYSEGYAGSPHIWVWMCDQCDQVREKGHAPDCPKLHQAVDAGATPLATGVTESA